MQTLKHGIPPVYNNNSRILILGSFPSPKSRETGFFYGHPRNRFWHVLSAVLGCEIPLTIDDKKSMLLENNIALWDVIAECDIENASDSSITNVIPNDISSLVHGTRITAVFTTGAKATELYRKYSQNDAGIPAISLPSTSPANAAFSLERFVSEYSVIKKHLGVNNETL